MTFERSMQGKVVLVTGATDGIGKETALGLARLGANVTISGRNADKASRVAEEIRKASGNENVDFLVSDLSSRAGVQALAQQFRDRHQRLDVLVNNAGAYFVSRSESADGYEMTFALNHLNYFLLTHLLLDLLKKSAPSRIVNVSSGAHYGGRINFDDLNAKKRFMGWREYSQSKLANVLFSYELARRLEGTGVTVNALHPGFVATNFGRSNGGLFDPLFKMTQLLALTPARGAETSIYLASSPEVEGVTGKYFQKKRAVASSAASYDRDTARRLWEVSEEMTGLRTVNA